jgi:phage head maturation protease
MQTHSLTAAFTRAEAGSEAMTVPAVLSTETPVSRGDYQEILSHKPGAIDLSRFPLPVIEGHDRSRVNIAIVENPTISKGKLRGTVRFGESQRAKELYADVKAGIVPNLSVGYQWKEYQENGDTVIVTRWQPYELSIVSIPADTQAGFYRSQTMLDENTTASGDVSETVDNSPIAKRAAIAERQRITEIRKFGSMARVDESTINGFIERGISAADAKAQMLEKWSAKVDAETSRCDPISVTHHIGFGGNHDVRAAMVDGMLLRSGIKIAKPHPAARDFTHVSIREIATILLRERGDYGVDQSPAALIKRAMSTSDLPHLLENVANKAMISGFEEAPQTHDAFCSFVPVSDFKTQSRIALSAFESLTETPELAEVKYSALSDSKETYAIASYQRAISLSRQSLINDDLSELTTVPQKLSMAARRTEADLVYNIFTGNPVMADGVTLFHADRGNLLTGAGSALSATSLALAVVALRKAKDIGNHGFLGIKPRWLIVPPELEITALQLIGSLTNTQASATAIPNSDFARLEVIVEPRLTSTTAWFLLGQGVETIEVGRLDANGISFESSNDFDRDAFKMKVRLDVGAKALSPLAMVNSAGA